jgi:AraC-like DNA-binding protein
LAIHDELLRGLPNSFGGTEHRFWPCDSYKQGFNDKMSTARSYRPLKSYPGFRAANLQELADKIRAKLGADIIDVDDPPAAFEATGSQCKLPSSELRYCDYGIPITLRFPETDEVRIQFGVSGAGKTRVGDDVVPVTLESSCISSRPVDVFFGQGFSQIAWRVAKPTLQKKLAALTGLPISRPIEFDSSLDMTAARPPLRDILDSLLSAVDGRSSDASRLMVSELEGVLLTAVLCTAQHNYRAMLDRPAAEAGFWQVRRAEAYIEAHWNEPLTIDALAEATGTSGRSIYRAFKASRGYSPFRFAKDLRLRHAREKLTRPKDSAMTVTAIALACGFENVSRFSKDFSEAFGETPSAILRRAKGTFVD